MSKVRTTITLDEEMLKEVTELADEKERSVSQQIVYFIKVGLKREREGKGEE